MEKFEEDIAWLLREVPSANEKQQDHFAELVAKWACEEPGYDDDYYRSHAYFMMRSFGDI